MTSVNSGIKIRLTALGGAAGLMGVLIVASVLALQERAVVTRERLSAMDSESFRIEDQIKDKLHFANDKMRRFSITEDPAVWDDFLKASQDIKVWIGQQTSRLTARPEQEILSKLRGACAAYMQRAEELHSRLANDNKTGASLADFNSFMDQSRAFRDLGQELARAHYQARNEVIEHVSRNLSELRFTVLGLVGFLFMFGLALAAVVYRNLITPLRVKLVESRALAERNEKLASLGLLAAGVAHEIRNPLTAIKTALFIQQKNFTPGSPQQSDGELVEREVLRLERIVTEFLRFAKPAEPQPATIAADAPLREVQELLAPQLERADICLLRESAERLRIRVDPEQIKQVLINLVQNAADSIGRGGTISLRARPGRKRLSNGETDVAVLEVADTGKGIAPEVEKRLFDPFFTTKDNGTGLGLSIAARIVELNGGSLEYQTQVNQGSTFGVVLPLANG